MTTDTERDQARAAVQQKIAAALAEKVDADDTNEESDRAYNQAIDDAMDAMNALPLEEPDAPLR